MKRAMGVALWVAAMMLLMLGLALLGFERMALDWQRYDRYQAQLELAPSVGVSEDALRDVQKGVAGYLMGALPADQMNHTVEMFGTEQSIFNEREMAHMVDVEALFRLERKVKLWSLGLGLVTLLGAMVVWRRGFRFAGLVALGMWLWMAVTFAGANGFDFDRMFTRFHELLFSNELWLLNPATDAMIRMYPIQFFEWMARDIAVSMGLFALVAVALPFLLARKEGEQGDEL